MTRVEEGILIDSQHQYNVLHNIPEEVNFFDKIIGLGYGDLNEFFEDKALYQMRNVLKNNIYSIDMKDFIPTLMGMIQNQTWGIISISTEVTCVVHGDNEEKPLNREYCEEHNIPIYPYNSFGGNIVAAKGDYGVVFLIPRSIDITEYFILDNLANILGKHFDNVEAEGNDILIDGKKVVGTGCFGNEQFFFMMIYFSMVNKGELIRKICGEPLTDKEPGYIDQEVLSEEQLKEEVLSWLQGL